MNNQPQVIVGIDPGFAITGYAVIEKRKATCTPLTYGVITTDKHTPFAERLNILHKELHKLLETYKPQAMGIEQLFFAKNTTTALQVAHARGVMLLLASKHKLDIHEFTPLQIKQGITNYGRANKQQMQRMITLLYKLDHTPQPDDAADALAVAWCCAQHC